MIATIQSIVAREILDSRGNPTVSAEVKLDSGAQGCACVPSGASRGSREALELRDQDPDRYLGKGVLKAVGNIQDTIAPELLGLDARDQVAVDQKLLTLDGTPNKSIMGANAVLAVSLAVAKAAAKVKGQALYRHIADLNGTSGQFSLPLPMMNIVNGGEHADNNIDIQEFMVQPIGAASMAEAVRMGSEVFHTLKAVLQEHGLSTAVGDEGGFAPNLGSNEEALQIIQQAVQTAGYSLGKDFSLALDCAASGFYSDEQYQLRGEGTCYRAPAFADYLARLCSRYPIVSIEDGMDENDWDGWLCLTEKLGRKVQLVGDDLFVTNTHILAEGIEKNIANAILIKFNQVGTLTETLAAIRMAKAAGYAVIVSHRSGETEDTSIADLAVGTAAGQIKTGSLCRTDRVAKYNRLLKIAEELGDRVDFAGVAVIKAQRL